MSPPRSPGPGRQPGTLRPGRWRPGTEGRGPTEPPDRARPAASAALGVLTLASAAGLFRVFSTGRWLGPVVVMIICIHGLCWVLRRVTMPPAVAAPLIAAGVILVAVWTLLGRYTVGGIPTGRTWHQAVSALGDVPSQFASTQPPVAPSRAFELLAVLGAGVASALADWIAFRLRTPLVAVLPGLSVFIFCAAAGVGGGRGPIIGAEVAAICAFLLVERSTGPDRLWFATVRSGVMTWTAAVGGIVSLVAVVAGLALSPALASRDGKAILGYRSGFGHGGGTRIVENPLVDLRTRLTTFQNVPVFEVTSASPSYWRLTALDQFDGVLWQSTGSYGGFGSRLPGAPPAGQAVRTVRATFQIQQLASDWLPAQFSPISVQGVHGVTYDQSSQSLLAPRATSPELEYSVTSYQLLSTLSAAQLNAAPPLTYDNLVEANLQLPPLDERIINLADALTANAVTEYEKALAIQDFLRGPAFTYSLDPPTDGSGTDAIANFLFSTRTGYCQQFAGAYAVLARAAGLPTRLAIGFVQGDPAGPDSYQVHDGDAHTWPEVYFGPRYGWVPFEPTKGFAIPGTSGYNAIAGGTSTGPRTTPSAPATTVPTSPTVPSSSPRSLTPKTLPAGESPTLTAHQPGHLSPWLLVIPVAVVAWPVLNTIIPWLSRKRRRRIAAGTGSRSQALNAWDELTTELAWAGVVRHPDETHDEFARRAAVALRRLDVAYEPEVGGLAALAGMARQAAFAAEVPADLGARAARAADRIERSLASRSGRRRRLARLWIPPPGTWDRIVSALHPDPGHPGEVG